MNNSSVQPATKIIFVPTASTEFDDQGRICGSLDLPLSENGVAQAAQWAQKLTSVDIAMIYCGPATADGQTAKAFAKASAKKRKIKTVDAWQNLNHGLWQGKFLSELKENHSRFYRQWCENPDAIAPPAGETTTEVIDRVKPGFEKILRKQTGRTIMVVVPSALLNILQELAANAECLFDRVGQNNSGHNDKRWDIGLATTIEAERKDATSQLV